MYLDKYKQDVLHIVILNLGFLEKDPSATFEMCI